MAIAMKAKWCAVTLGNKMLGGDAFVGTILKTGDATIAAVGETVIVPRKKMIVAEGQGIPTDVVSIKLEDVIAKVT